MQLRFGMILATFLALTSHTAAHGQAMYSFDTPDDFFAQATDWPAWHDMLERHHTERTALIACLEDKTQCSGRLRSLRPVLLKGADLDFDQQLRLVNRYVNRRRYKDDRVSARARAGNQWITLAAFLESGGDCEDFAVAKYFILREFGVAADDMRIVVGKEAQRTTHHAMLAIRDGDQVWLLENDNTIRRNGSQDIDNFVYAVNEHGVWDHENRN